MDAPSYQAPQSLLGNPGTTGGRGPTAGTGIAGKAQQDDLTALQALLRGDTAAVLTRYGQRNALNGGAVSPLGG